MEIIIRPFKALDLARLIHCAVTAYSLTEQEGNTLLNDIKSVQHDTSMNPICNFYVATQGAKIIGCIRISEGTFGYNAYVLSWLAVHPTHQKTGVATMLMKQALKTIKKNGGTYILAETDEEWLTQKFGFTLLEKRRNGGYMISKSL